MRKFCGKGIFREIWKNRYVVLKGDQLYISEKEVGSVSVSFPIPLFLPLHMKGAAPALPSAPPAPARPRRFLGGLLFSPGWRRRDPAGVGVGVGSESDSPRQLCWETFSQRGDTKGFT